MRIGDVIAMVALVIVLLIAVIIVANMLIAVGQMHLTGSANTTASTVFTNTWTGLTLASIGIIIAAAVGILSLVLSTLGRGTGGVA